MSELAFDVVMIPVISSNVEAVGHDGERGRMRARYKGGVIYEYDAVTEDEFEAVLGADSVGSALRVVVKSKDYRRVA